MFRILISDKLGQAGLDILDQMDDVSYDMKTTLSKEELIAILPEYDALIIRSGTKADADILAAGTNLKVVGRAGIGVDNVDVKAATTHGIIVMNTPEANSITTAEQTMALLMSVSRHTAQAHASLKTGAWQRSQFTGYELYGKTLGILGFGRIGRLVCRRAQGMGMEVIAYDPFVSEELARDFNVTLVDLDDLLAQSDYLTLHAAYTPETDSLINANTLAQMKPTATLINVARGKLVDEQALANALDNNQLRAAALDVFRTEPATPDNPLIGHPKVLHTPHLGASTFEAQTAVAEQIVRQVVNALRKTEFLHAINLPFSVQDNYAKIRPYMDLAEKIGILHWSLAPKKIERVEIELKTEQGSDLIRPIAAALLKGILSKMIDQPVNDVSAPVLAEEHGLKISESTGISDADYSNLLTVRAYWENGHQTLSGVLFGSKQPRIVQMNDYHLDANPSGVVLILQNKDIPGVIGQIGTILAAYEINIGEWRMGRFTEGGEALSFINLDSKPSPQVLDAVSKISAITKLELVEL